MNYSADTTDIVEVSLFSPNSTDSPITFPAISYRNFTEYKIAVNLNVYYLKFLCPIGVILNSAAIATILRLKPFNTSSLYVTLLAVFDSLALIAKLSFIELTRADVNIGNGGCKVLCFLGSFLDQYAIWILVLLTLERFVAVWLPLKVSCWFTMFRARIAVIVTALALMIINSHILFVFHQTENLTAKGRDCIYYPQYEFFITTIWYWIESCLSGIIPCILLLVLNVLIIHRMRKSMEKQKKMVSASDPVSSQQSHKTHLTVMLVTVSVAFVFLVLPLAIFNTFRGTWNFLASPHETARYFLVAETTHLLADCNHGLNFLFYFISSRRFRKIFSMLVRCRTSQIYKGMSRASHLRSTTSTTNTYYMHTSMRANGGM